MPHSLILIDVKFDTASSLIKVHKHKFFSLLLVLSHPDSNRRLSLHVLFKYLKNIVYAGTDSCTNKALSMARLATHKLQSMPLLYTGLPWLPVLPSGSDKEKQCRRTENKPGQTTTRQEAEIEPEHLNLEMEATDWTLRGNAHLRRRSNSKHTDWHTVPVFVCLFEANLSVDTQTVITQVVCHVYMLI